MKTINVPLTQDDLHLILEAVRDAADNTGCDDYLEALDDLYERLRNLNVEIENA